MTSVRGQGYPIQRSQAFEGLINRFNNRNHKDSFGLNKPRPSKAFIGPEAPARPFQAPSPPNALDAARYMQKNMDHLF